MNKIYIRSQNKEKIYSLTGNYACVEYGGWEDIKRKQGGTPDRRHTICVSDGCLEEIAEYGSKERCMEVLDEIWELLGLPPEIQKTYQMPAK